MDTQSVDDAGSRTVLTTTESWTRRLKITWTYVGIMILVVAGIMFFRAVLASVFTFVIGGLLAFLLRPVVSLLMRWKFPRGLAVLVTALLLVVVLAFGLMAVLPQVTAEVQQIATALAAQQQKLHEAAATAATQLPSSAQASLAKAQAQAAAQAASKAKDLALTLLKALGEIGSIVLELFLGFIISIWFMLDGSHVAKWALSVLPPAWREDTAQVGRAFDTAFGGFIRGMAISMFLMFAGMALGFNLLGVPYAWALAALCGLLAVIPIIGGIVGGIIATLVALTISTQLAVWTLVVVLVVEQTVDSVIEPIVLGESVRLHPLAILFALAIGGAIAGIFGMIAAIPAVAAAYTVYLYFARKYGVLEPAPAAEPDAKAAKA